MKIGHPKDFWGGVMFAVIGLMFLVIARGIPGVPFLPGYTMGTAARMGPAYFPFWLGLLLFLIGVAISIVGIRTRGGEEAKLERWHAKPLIAVLVSIVVFGVLLKAVGMLIAGILLIVGASLGSPTFKLKPVIYLAVFLVVFCALVFVVGLKLPIPLCPDIDALQPYAICRA